MKKQKNKHNISSFTLRIFVDERIKFYEKKVCKRKISSTCCSRFKIIKLQFQCKTTSENVPLLIETSNTTSLNSENFLQKSLNVLQLSSITSNLVTVQMRNNCILCLLFSLSLLLSAICIDIKSIIVWNRNEQTFCLKTFSNSNEFMKFAC